MVLVQGIKYPERTFLYYDSKISAQSFTVLDYICNISEYICWFVKAEPLNWFLMTNVNVTDDEA